MAARSSAVRTTRHARDARLWLVAAMAAGLLLRLLLMLALGRTSYSYDTGMMRGWAFLFLVYAALIKPIFAALLIAFIVECAYRQRPSPALRRAIGTSLLTGVNCALFGLLVLAPFNVGLPPLRWTLFERLRVAADR